MVVTKVEFKNGPVRALSLNLRRLSVRAVAEISMR